MSSEKRFKTHTQDYLSQCGWCFCTHDVYRKGVPDLTGVVNGRAIWWELKWEPTDDDTVHLSHELTAPQSKVLRDVGQEGAHSGVLIGIDEWEAFFIPASKLSPGPHRSFSISDRTPLSTLVEKLCESEMDGHTSEKNS